MRIIDRDTLLLSESELEKAIKCLAGITDERGLKLGLLPQTLLVSPSQLTIAREVLNLSGRGQLQVKTALFVSKAHWAIKSTKREDHHYLIVDSFVNGDWR
jgi:hypothetical protein